GADRSAIQIRRKLCWSIGVLCGIEIVCGIQRELDEAFVGRCERAAQHRFVNKVDSEFEGVASRNVAQVVPNLVFVLITQRRKQSDGSGELVVAKSFEAGNGQRGRAEGKRQRKAEIRVACLGKVQQAGIDDQIVEPRRTERIRIAEHRVRVIVMGGQSGGGQSCLRYQSIVGDVAVLRGAQEPLRLRRLRPVKTERADVVAERDRNTGRYWN